MSKNTYSQILTKGYQSALLNTPIENGKIRVTTDTSQLFIDIDNSRIEITDIIKDLTEEEIKSLLVPLPKFYLASDTYKLLVYNTDNDEWVNVAKSAENDGLDQNISETYIKDLSVNGTTITFTKGDNSTFTIDTQDTTYNEMGPASESSAGSSGLVPAPAAGDQKSFLRGDGTWVEIQGVSGLEEKEDKINKVTSILENADDTHYPSTKAVKDFIEGKGYGYYSKPESGIPGSDLAQSVQDSLTLANSALQSFTENDPTVPIHVKNISSDDIDNWNAAQPNVIESIKVNNTIQSVTDKSVNITVPTTAAEVGALADTVTHLSGDVPITRTINGKALSDNISLSASDVGALPSGTFIPTVTDTYSATSSNGMSGKAVASAISGKENSSNKVTSISNASTNTQYPSAKAVFDAIEALPEPMIFKGSLGTGGTITSLPTAAKGNTGYTYKVITAGTYASIAAKVGDTFISDGTAWVLIPSGDEPSGTVTSVAISATSPITIDSSAAITSSGTRTISHANSGATAGSYGDSAAQTPAYGGTFKVPYITVNATGHVTGISEHTVKIPATDNTWRPVQNNLTSTSTTESLSAAQGKVLNDGKMGIVTANGYPGMANAAGVATGVWIRTTDQGIIPDQPGDRGSGHCGLGTSSWYFATSYVDNAYTNRTTIGDKVRLEYNTTNECLDFNFI